MAISAKVILDSVGPNEYRLTTMELEMPRFLLAQWNTHRAFSRNAASSRAIPFAKLARRVMDNPFVPSQWGMNQKGMQADNNIDANNAEYCRLAWMWARDHALYHANSIALVNVHKQLLNRLLEPFLWVTVIATAVDSGWNNMFWQRCSHDAQPEFQELALKALRAYHDSNPTRLQEGQWHTPYIQPDEYIELEISKRLRVSTARCARVSYLTHDGIRDIEADIALYDKLLDSGHMSPFEHIAEARSTPGTAHQAGNLTGWWQLRKMIPSENRRAMTREQREAILVANGA